MKHTLSPSAIRIIKFILLGILGITVFLFLISYFRSGGASFVTAASFNNKAEQIVSRCSTSGYRPSCYDEEIPKLALSMEDAFSVTKLVQDKDPSYNYCHVLGHELAANETKKNPDAWKAIVNHCPSGLCSNGCIHGAFQERFRTDRATSDEELEMMKKEIENICEKRADWNPTGMEQGSCYHALGHLVMYITSANIPTSLELCDELVVKGPDRDFAQLCYDGVFMQIFQPLEPEDFALIAGKEIVKEQHPSFCNQFTGRARGSCWTEGWPVHLDEIHTPEGLASYCSYVTGVERDRCFRALTYVIVPLLKLDRDAVANYCAGLPVERQISCYSDAAARMMEIDWRNTEKAVGLCLQAQEDIQSGCFEELVQLSSYNYHRESQERRDLCERMPEQWRIKCLE